MRLPPRLRNLLLALMPVFPPAYAPLAVAGLFEFPRLPYWIKKILAFVAALQILAALLSPEPLVSVPLALLRVMLIYGLLGFGFSTGTTRVFKYVLIGYLVIYLTALITSFHQYDISEFFSSFRLIHLYYTTVSLGLAGVVGIFFVIMLNNLSWPFRAFIGVFAITILLFSGSRGALLALLVGGLIAGIMNSKIRLYLFKIFAFISFIIFIFSKAGNVFSINRFLNFTYFTGRDKIWQQTIETFLSHIWGGVGPYQVGLYVRTQWKQSCHWLVLEYLFNSYCKSGLGIFDIARVTAHNTLLHALAETGIVGTAGWILLYGLIGYAVWRARDPLLAAIFFGYMAMGLVDNPTAVPSYSLAEVFWISAGIALAKSGLAGSAASAPGSESPPAEGPAP